MKIQLNKIAPFLLLLVLGASMLHISLSIVLFITVALMILSDIIYKRQQKVNHIIKRIKKRGIVSILIVTCFYIVQLLVLQLNISSASYALCVISAIFIFVLIQCFLLNSLNIKYAFAKAVCSFDLIFSAYYLYKVIISGLPEDRNSVLGYVSSNYCASILYLTFPIMLYTLFSLKKDSIDNKRLRKMILASLSLSIIVILLSGSRTAFGALAMILLSLLIYKQENMNDKIKKFAIIGIGLIIVYIAYKNVPTFRSLLVRAMAALEGNQGVTEDIRSVAWMYALENYQSYNHLIGSGSNMVYQLSRPAHNFFIEILLTVGYIGCSIFAVFIINSFWPIVKKISYEKRFFTIQLLVLSILVAYVQPFFTTAFTCGIIVWGSFYAMYFDE